MKKNSIFCVILALSMLFTVAVSADFSDMPEDERANTAILNAVSNGILSGYEDGTVRPNSPITRAEMASIITRACGATAVSDISFFADLSTDAWYYEAFQKAYTMGAFRGDENYCMSPENNITFQETFTVLSQVFDLLPPYTRTTSAPDPMPQNKVYTVHNYRLYDVSAMYTRDDTWDAAEWAKVYVAGIVANGGCDGITVSLGSYITRAQFAIVMDNIIKNYIDDPGTYDSLPEGTTMIRCDDVFLNNVTTNDDIYIADGVSQGGIAFNNVTANRLIVRGCATPVDSSLKLMNDNFGITISGTFEAIRIIRPYIIADLMPANYKKLYTAPNTSVNLGTLTQE